MPARKVEYLLIGGGLASANCARWLREEGAEGEVVLVGREPDPPYNRPNCSKGYLQGKETREETFFRPNEWWEEQRIELGDHEKQNRPHARWLRDFGGSEQSAPAAVRPAEEDARQPAGQFVGDFVERVEPA